MFHGNRSILAIFAASAVASMIFYLGLKSAPDTGGAGGTGGAGNPKSPPLLVYAAASLRAPLTQAAKDFETETGIRIELQFGSSQAILSSAELSRRGDLLLAADDEFAAVARSRNLIDESMTLARQSVRILVAKDNPKSISSVADLQREGVRISLADPEVTAIGRMVRARLRETGQWDALAARATVVKPTIVDAANDVKIGAVDAALLFDSMAALYPELTVLQIDPLTSVTATVPACVLKSTVRPADALAFARYLAASDRGAKVFRSAGFAVDDSGDVWQRTPVDQPLAVGRTSAHRMLSQRLMDAIGSAQSKERFESWGFKWK